MGAMDECCDDCCSCYSWKQFWWCMLFLTIIAVIAAIVILVAAFGFVRRVSVTVDDASLTHMALVTTPTTTAALAYNLSLTLTVRNPNWAMTMTNKAPLDAAYAFDGQQFDRVRLADDGDTHPAGKTRVYRLVSGADSASVALGNAGVAEFRKENATGTFDVEVRITGEVKYTARVTKCKIEASCPLKLQLAPTGSEASSAAVVFQRVKCKLAKAEANC